MNRSHARRKPDDLPGAANVVVTMSLLVLVFLLCSGGAQACCTCSSFHGCNPRTSPEKICCGDYCVSASNECVCGNQTPVCNFLGCNCNYQCGEWPCTFRNDRACHWFSTCSDSAAEAQEAQERFNAIDVDHDGKISLDEAWALTQSLGQPWVKRVHKLPEHLSAPNVNEKEILRFLLDQIDTNKDGFIQPVEMDKSLAPSAKTDL